MRWTAAKLQALVVLACLMPGTLLASGSQVFYYEDFQDVSEWTLYDGTGSFLAGGNLTGIPQAKFYTQIPRTDSWGTALSVLAVVVNASSYDVWAYTTTDKIVSLFGNLTLTGRSEATLNGNYQFDGLLLVVYGGTVQFQEIIIHALSDLAALLQGANRWFFQVVTVFPWIMPAGLLGGIALIALLLAYPNQKLRRR